MRFLIDTFSPTEAEKVAGFYPVEGITTNPSIICREKTELKSTLLKLMEIVPGGMLHVQTMQTDCDAMVDEALKLNELLGKDNGAFYVKLPCTKDGIKACAELKRRGVGVTVTAIFSPVQALIAARAGADFVAPYVNKLDDVGDGELCVERIARLFEIHKLDTKILSASFRNTEQVLRVALSGSHYITLPPAFFEKLVYSPMTELALKGFESDWQNQYGDKKPADLI